MSDLMLNLTVLGVLAVLSVVIFLYLRRRKQLKDEMFQQAAQERGWQVERIQKPFESGYKIKGKNAGSSWVLETIAETSSNDSGQTSSSVSYRTNWWTDEITMSEGAIVIGPISNQGDIRLINQFGAGLLQAGLRVMLGKESQWAAELTPIQAGSAVFLKKYLCLGKQMDQIQNFLRPEVEKILLKLADRHKVVVMLRSSGLVVNLPHEQLLDPNELDQIIDLGKVIALTWKSNESSFIN